MIDASGEGAVIALSSAEGNVFEGDDDICTGIKAYKSYLKLFNNYGGTEAGSAGTAVVLGADVLGIDSGKGIQSRIGQKIYDLATEIHHNVADDGGE